MEGHSEKCFLYNHFEIVFGTIFFHILVVFKFIYGFYYLKVILKWLYKYHLSHYIPQPLLIFRRKRFNIGISLAKMCQIDGVHHL